MIDSLRSRTLLVPVVLAALALVCLGGEPVHLVVLHTNDVHGQVLPTRSRDRAPSGGLPRVAAYVDEVRAEVAASGAGLLVLDAGDWFQGTPEGMLDEGLPFVRALVAVGYDALCVGNHEFDRGLDNLRRILREAKVPAVLANVRERGADDSVAWAEPYVVVERAGLAVAIVGLLATETPAITHRDARTLDFVDPLVVLRDAIARLGDDVDLVIPLGHLGIEEDRRIAREVPGLPLVVGGHSHTFLEGGERVGETLIVQAGAKARAVGRVDLWYDPDERRVVRSLAQLVELEREPSERAARGATARLCAKLVERTAGELDVVVGKLAAPLERGSGHESSTAGNWITDVMRAGGSADVAIQNRGGIRAEVPAGAVTRRQLVEILPFGNTLVTFELTGAELRESVRRAVESTERRGIELSGMRLHVRAPLVEGGATQLVDLEVGGKPLDPARRYRVATNSFLFGGGDGFFGDLTGRQAEHGSRMLRELCEDALRASSPVTPPAENRYVVRGDR